MDMGDGYGDFRMMNRQMAEAILEMKEYNRYMKGIFSFVGFHTKWIPFENVERESGESKWNFKSLLGYAAEGILSFSTTPLKLAGIFGALLLAAGLLVLLVNLVQQILYSRGAQPVRGASDCYSDAGGNADDFLYIIGSYLAEGLHGE